jgi:hypothetical protein
MRRAEHQPAYAGPQRLWTRPAFILSAILLALVVAAGTAIVVMNSGPAPTDPAQAPGVAEPAGDDPSSWSADSSPPTAPAGALPTQMPKAPPRDVTWQLIGQVAVPVSASAGPRRTSDTIAAGYAHTPTGALVAAAQLLVRSAHSSGRKIWEPTISQQFVAGRERDALLSAMRADPDEVAQPGELAQIAAFLYQAYSPDTAVIALGFRGPDGADYFVTATLQWRDGDWRVAPPPGAAWLLLSGTSEDLTAAIKWGAA